jgi:DNA mismatch repair protein MutS
MSRLKEGEKVLHENLPVPAAVPKEPRDDRLKGFIADLRSLNPDRMTPLEALNRIHTWKALFASHPVSHTSRGNRGIPLPSLFDEEDL